MNSFCSARIPLIRATASPSFSERDEPTRTASFVFFCGAAPEPPCAPRLAPPGPATAPPLAPPGAFPVVSEATSLSQAISFSSSSSVSAVAAASSSWKRSLMAAKVRSEDYNKRTRKIIERERERERVRKKQYKNQTQINSASRENNDAIQGHERGVKGAMKSRTALANCG